MTDVVKKGIDKVRLMCVRSMRCDDDVTRVKVLMRFDFGTQEFARKTTDDETWFK